jgi:hypothetical protein
LFWQVPSTPSPSGSGDQDSWRNKPHKEFRLAANQIRDLARGYGACIAGDRITGDGTKVGYCYRETPDGEPDSGWRFFAGDETQAYVDDAGKFAVCDINTANYDPDIIPLLDAPAGLRFRARL